MIICSQPDKSIVQEQHQLIKQLNEERKSKERHWQPADEDKGSLQQRSESSGITSRELPPGPQTPTSGSSKGEMIPNPSRRIWIREESPELAIKTRGVSDASGASGSWNSDPIPNRFENEKEDSPSLLDMATFLRLGESDNLRTPRRSSEDTTALPSYPDQNGPKYQPRSPTVRGDCSDLISFFREGYTFGDKGSSIHAPRNFTMVQRGAAPVTPPLTGVDEDKPKSSPPLPTHFAPLPPRLRSQSANLPSPLGSHPPQRPFDPTRPATTNWPPQAVLAWLETNSFSAEWRGTFRELQIWGSEFVELESGQSIRKMLTVIYPQLAKECAATGKGWDQARERAEGQRLRRLIRELPVDLKYEDRSAAAAAAAAAAAESDTAGAGMSAEKEVHRTMSRTSSKPNFTRPLGRKRATTNTNIGVTARNTETSTHTHAASEEVTTSPAITSIQASRSASRRRGYQTSEDMISLPEHEEEGGDAHPENQDPHETSRYDHRVPKMTESASYYTPHHRQDDWIRSKSGRSDDSNSERVRQWSSDMRAAEPSRGFGDTNANAATAMMF